LMKVCTQNVVKIKREIVAVDADVFCEGFDGDSRGALEFVSELYFNFHCPPIFLWPYLWVWGLLRLARWSRGSLSSFNW